MFNPAAVADLPDVVVRSGSYPAERRPRLVATGYGGSVQSSFSGTAAFLAEAGIKEGSLDGAFTLWSASARDHGLLLRGAAWKARQLLRRHSASGFKYSDEFSAYLWRRHLPALAGTDVVSTFQLFSERFFDDRSAFDVRAFFYLDGTLHDYLRGYGRYDVAGIHTATVDRAIEAERKGYQRADGIAVMSRNAAHNLAAEYGVKPERITVVTPGANLSDALACRALAARAARAPGIEFTVGFVGVYPERKGLRKLAGAIALLRAQRVPVRLQVIGNCPEDIARADGVDALGVIDKSTDPDAFADALSRVDLGCQLSTVELFGIALLEFIRCGIPVLATTVGGVPDALLGGGGVGLDAGVSVDEVAEAIREVVEDETLRDTLTRQAVARSEAVRWEHSAALLGRFIEAAD